MTVDAAPSPAPEIVDWAVAASMARRLARPGPTAQRAELVELVESLRTAAAEAVPHVLATTGMRPAPGPTPLTLGAVYIVDRARWAQANTEVMAAMTHGVAEAVSPDGMPAAAALAGAAEVGAVLAALSGRVLGQFDPYSGHVPGGRLLLVAPNVLQVERALEIDPDDFRLWVALHEQTHALQFAAAPWLADHLRERARGLLVDVSASSRRLAEARLREKLSALGRAVLGALRGDGVTLANGLLTEADRATLEEVTAVMALLEGHADVAMDAVGPEVVPSVAVIRERFEARRDGAGRGVFDAVVRRLLGMNAKLAQYRDGAAFVRGVESAVGRDGLNAVWAGPEHLPTAREIADPPAWVRRVHG